ncbi:polysaccharide biosynthesis tyrosine autokinase [Mesorhizobium sp. SB112]|uniref:polysaccharide biosynthesis tyrosine autokinase n=1 Tax=Mesorhizobium sp. SB112 TaxID=3151853 RepID=UPI003263A2D4
MHQKTIPLNSRVTTTPPEDEDRFIDLERLMVIARRQIRVVILCAIVGLALGVVYLLFTPSVYTASTRVLLDENLARFAEDREATPVRAQADSMILSEVEIMKSARLARVVVMAENLQNNEAFLNPPQGPVAWLKGQVKAVTSIFSSSPPQSESSAEQARIGKAAAMLQGSLSAERVGRSFVVELSLQASDPALAGSITRAYAKAYLSDQLDANFDATQRATVWLQERLDELRQNSQTAASDVARFKAENGLTSARGELLSEQQLSDLNSQLILAQAETANTLARFNQYQSIIDSGAENAVQNATIPPDQANSAVLNELKTRYLSVTKREQDVTSRFGEEHPQAVSLRREQEDLTRQIYGELRRVTESYRNEYEVAKSRETSLRTSLGQMTGDSSDANQALVKLRELEQKSAALATLYQAFLARYEEASQQQSFPIAKARVISEASNPVGASSPRKSMILALSLVLGMMVGGAAAAFQEFQERFFRTGEDVRNSLDLDFLGYLPLVGRRKSGSDGGPVPATGVAENSSEAVTSRILRIAVSAPASSFAETLRNAKLAADVVLQGQPCKVIGFVSVLPHEGKTTAAANFASLLAANGARTLLIDGDLRNPGLSRSLSLKPDQGLVEAVVGEQSWRNVLKIDRSTRLAIIPAFSRGRLTHTAELISGAGMRALLDDARNSFDYIVVDLPPMGPVVDAKAFAPLADGFVLVAEWGSTPRALVRSTLESEPGIEAKTLGVMLNKTDMKKLASYSAPGGSEQYIERYASYYTDQSGLN